VEKTCSVHFLCDRFRLFGIDLVETELCGNGVDGLSTAETISLVDAAKSTKIHRLQRGCP
jgi:hypothetical protein